MNRRKLCHHQQIHGLTASITPFFNVSLLVVLSSLQEAFILNSKCSESTVWSSENEMKFKWYWIMVKNHLHSFIIIFPNYLFSQVKVTFTFIYVWFFQTTCSLKWKSHLHSFMSDFSKLLVLTSESHIYIHLCLIFPNYLFSQVKVTFTWTSCVTAALAGGDTILINKPLPLLLNKTSKCFRARKIWARTCNRESKKMLPPLKVNECV